MAKSQLETKFNTTGKKGNAGEEMLYQHLCKSYQVSDYRLNWDKQNHGIDFGIKKPEWKFEVQLDVKNNLYVESNLIVLPLEFSRGTEPGWLYTSHSHRIYHMSTYTRTCVMYDINKMRYFINKRLLDNNLSGIRKEVFGEDVILKLNLLEMPDALEICTKFLV